VLEDLLDHGAVFGRQLAGVLVVGMTVADLLHLDPQDVAVAGLGAAGDQPAVEADDGGDGAAATGDAGLDHLGDDADAAVLAVTARDQEDALLLADVDRQGRGHGGKDDCLVQRYQPISHNQVHFL
jgi:hypothetical protein